MSRSGGGGLAVVGSNTGVAWIFTFSDVILFTLETEQQKK